MRNKAALLGAAFIAATTLGLAAQATAIPKKFDIGKAPAVLAANCSPCHDWARSRQDILDAGIVVPGKPDESPAWQMISQDAMPPSGPLGEGDKGLILAWIEGGAPPGSPESAAAASATAAGPARPPAGYLGFPSKEAFHRFSGWASGGILLAAGVVGAIHAYDMMTLAHEWRDANYPNLDNFSSSTCAKEVDAVYNSPTEQALRWTHVGLLGAGTGFYIANALTGTSFMGRLPPGWSKAKIHRYAFFTHAALMASEAAMGYFSSDALQRGDHETFRSLLVAHAGVGLVIPVVILGAGTIMDPRIKL
jgi:hypothetical protein